MHEIQKSQHPIRAGDRLAQGEIENLKVRTRSRLPTLLRAENCDHGDDSGVPTSRKRPLGREELANPPPHEQPGGSRAPKRPQEPEQVGAARR